MPLKALIWDVDGTLAETEAQGHRVAFNRAFADAGPPWSAWHWDEALYGELLAVTGGKERMLAWWRRIDPDAAARDDAAAAIARLHAAKTAHYVALVEQGAVALRPGVHALIDAARAAGLWQAIATTTTLDNVTALLDRALGAAHRRVFDPIGAGDVVPRKKPAPDIYAWVLERLDGIAPHEALAIEDSAAGAAAARAAGVPVLVVRSVYTQREDVGAVAADRIGFDFGLDELARWHARVGR